MNSFKKILFVLCAVFVASFNAHAEVYEVKDITVEFKRFNQQKIRAYAVEVATKRGFTKLLENIVPQEYNVKELIDQVNFKKVDVVEKLNITEEVNVKGRYFAKFDIIYSEDKIKQILQAKRIPYTQKTMGKVLLLPIMQNSSGQLELFEDTNLFKDYIFNDLSESLLIQPVMAKADLQEITTYNPQNVLDTNNTENIIQLATKYETNKIMIVLVEQNDPDNKNIYQVSVKYINFDDATDENFIVLGQSLELASKEISNKIISLWKDTHLIELNKPKRFIAMINTMGSIDELEATIKHIESLKMVSRVLLTQVTTRYAFVQTDFYGSPQEFLDTAKAKRLNIFKSDNGQWTIERVLD